MQSSFHTCRGPCYLTHLSLQRVKSSSPNLQYPEQITARPIPHNCLQRNITQLAPGTIKQAAAQERAWQDFCPETSNTCHAVVASHLSISATCALKKSAESTSGADGMKGGEQTHHPRRIILNARKYFAPVNP